MRQKQASRNNKKSIEKAELMIIAFFAIFGIVWIAYVSPMLQYSKFFLSLNPIEAYFVYNIGTMLFFIALFGIPVGYFIKGEINFTDIIRGGAASWIGASLIFDTWQPPWAWNQNGTLAIIPTPENMETIAVDYVWGWGFEQIGIHGFLLWACVYFVVVISGIILMALLLKPKELLKVLGGK